MKESKEKMQIRAMLGLRTENWECECGFDNHYSTHKCWMCGADEPKEENDADKD